MIILCCLFVDGSYRPFLMSYERSRNDYINAVIIPVSLSKIANTAVNAKLFKILYRYDRT